MRMLAGLPGRDRRALAIGGVITGLALLYRASLPATSAVGRMRDANQSASDRLALVRGELLAAAVSDDSLAVQRARLQAADSALLPSGSPARVASELGSILRVGSPGTELEFAL